MIKSSTPLVSVLMTAYNREKYIEDAIKSVLASSYKNFELIIVDDCSRDKTYAIAKKYELKDSRIKAYRNDHNLAQFGNRNKAATYAGGDFLKYVDSDDMIYEFTLQWMVDAMLQFPDAALGFCLTDGKCRHPLPYRIEPGQAFKQHFFEGGLLFVGPSGLIITKEAFESVNGFEEFGMPSDNHLTLKIAARYPVVAMARDLFWWRLHEDQVFTHNLNNYYNILNNYEYSKDIIINHSPLPETYNKRILRNLQKIFLKHVLGLAFKQFKPALAIRLLVQSAREK